ncbi:MAG: transcriptional regulator NrdR [Pseudomonadota bacterium]
MRCPFCGNADTQVRDSRPTEEHAAIRRRRYCPACGGRFTTFERVQLRDLVVIKTDGRREDFDRDKLARSIRLAMNRRHIEPERLDQLITGIVRRLETGGDTDIASHVIGDEVMRALERTDPVGYLRYASVYKNFDSIHDFIDFVKAKQTATSDADADDAA